MVYNVSIPWEFLDFKPDGARVACRECPHEWVLEAGQEGQIDTMCPSCGSQAPVQVLEGGPGSDTRKRPL